MTGAVPAVAPDLSGAIRAAREQHQAGAGAVLDILLRTPGLDRTTLAGQLEASAGVAVLLSAQGVTPDFSRLDQSTARNWRCVAMRSGERWLLAAEDPWDEALMQRAARRLGVQAMPAAATRAMLAGWLGGGMAHERESAALPMATPVSGPIVSFVDQALRTAYDMGASDVHFECDRVGVNAKHRADGVLVPYARLDGVQQAQEVISRIKVLAQLDITERRLPQDGRFRFDFGGSSIDLRVSIMPSVHGEDAVLRLLDKARLRGPGQNLSLSSLGFDAPALSTIRSMATQPSGMLLVTGPTGSGKTTTVYAALSEINTGSEKLITIEDPVEYELAGVLQIPVNDRKGLTFAKGLRSILRHDPDRILVGEIRDAETAEIAVQSALTGHLVFTTVHANSMADVVGRFRHFGLDMFGFMSSLNGVLVQRLVREVCPHCSTRRRLLPAEEAWLQRCGLQASEGVPVANGCAQCRHTGYRGRFVVSEVHPVDDTLRDHVTGGAPLSVLKAHAAALNIEPLSVRAARQVVAGRTTPEEVRRVVGW